MLFSRAIHLLSSAKWRLRRRLSVDCLATIMDTGRARLRAGGEGVKQIAQLAAEQAVEQAFAELSRIAERLAEQRAKSWLRRLIARSRRVEFVQPRFRALDRPFAIRHTQREAASRAGIKPSPPQETRLRCGSRSKGSARPGASGQ